MGHFPAHQTGPVAPKGKGRGKANPANISGGLASDSVARAETGQPEKGLALVLETKKGEGLKAWSSRGQDLMIDVFHNGVHAETRHCSSKMDFSQPLVFSGTRIRYLVEKAWTFQAAQGQILSDVGKVPRDIALDRWRAIGDSLAGEAESFGRRENGQVPPVADYLFALAAAPYPEKLADLQELGQARFGVIDVVLTLGNADRLPRSATYLQRAAKRPDPGYPHSTFLPSGNCVSKYFPENGLVRHLIFLLMRDDVDNTGTERPVAKAMGKRNQAGSAGAGKAPQKQQDETQGPGEGQPAALGSHEATHGSLRATYDDATMTMEDLEREIQAEEDLAAEGEFESTLRYLRSAPSCVRPIRPFRVSRAVRRADLPTRTASARAFDGEGYRLGRGVRGRIHRYNRRAVGRHFHPTRTHLHQHHRRLKRGLRRHSTEQKGNGQTRTSAQQPDIRHGFSRAKTKAPPWSRPHQPARAQEPDG